MGDRFYFIAQLNPSYFAYISGIAISTAINLLTGLVTGGREHCFDLSILGASLFLLGASITFVVLSWNLEEPYHKWKTISRELDWSEAKIHEVAVSGKSRLLWGLMITGALLFFLGFVILLVWGPCMAR
jgi:hypothetical protein